MATYTEIEMDEDEFSDFLDEIYEPVDVAGMTFNVSTILKECDPIAFRCAMSDQETRYECDVCLNVHDNEDDAANCCDEPEEDEA